MARNIDRFSLLPFHLLSAIISFIPFKDAVRTSVLCKNWLNVCKFTTNIEFNELFFVKLDQPDDATREAQRRAFLDFTTCWIDNHQGNEVTKFSLRLSNPKSVREVIEKCILFTTQRGVKVLELDFADPNWNENNVYCDDHDAVFDLPTHVYGHNTLESLKLYSCGFVGTEMLNFYSLKEVFFGWMEVRISAIKALLSNCKLLENLSFKKCWSLEDFNLWGEEIRGLRKLVLDNCHFRFSLFKLDVPNLKVFKYRGLMDFFVIQIYTPQLKEVDLDFSPEYGWDGHGHFLYTLVEYLYSARVFTVCSYVLQVLPSGIEDSEQPLCVGDDMNVRHLIMKTALHEHEFLGIALLLNSCPKLKCLTIELSSEKVLLDYEPVLNFNRTRFWIENVQIYKCLISSLKVVEIKGFKGSENEILVLKYFITCGKKLKMMSINILKGDGVGSSNGGNAESYHREKAESLLKIRRASTRLEILIS